MRTKINEKRKESIYADSDSNIFNPKKIFYEIIYDHLLFCAISCVSLDSGLVNTDDNSALYEINNIQKYLSSLKKMAILKGKIESVWQWEREKVYDVLLQYFITGSKYNACERIAIAITEICSDFLLLYNKSETEIKNYALKITAVLLYLICIGAIKNTGLIYKQLNTCFDKYWLNSQ